MSPGTGSPTPRDPSGPVRRPKGPSDASADLPVAPRALLGWLATLALGALAGPVLGEYEFHGWFPPLAGVLTPLLLQGWIPAIATFMNTPAWTMSAEAFYYFIFPWLAKMKKPDRLGPYLGKMAWIWALGILPGALYVAFNPDGIAHPDRYSYGIWLWALKYTPYTHIASFIFGVMLANVNAMIPRDARARLWMGLAGFGGQGGSETGQGDQRKNSADHGNHG